MVFVTIAFLHPFAGATKGLKDNSVMRRNARTTVQDMVFVLRVFVRATIRTMVRTAANVAHAETNAVLMENV